MKTRLILGSLALLAIFSAPSTARAAGSPMQPGQWEITSSVEMEGMPHPIPPSTFTHCIKPEDVKDPESMVRQSQQQKDDCELKDVKSEGNRVTWSVECHKKNSLKGSGTMVFSGGSYEGTINMEMTDPQRGPMKIITHIRGRRIGDCK